MSRPDFPQQALLTFADTEKSPLSIRAKALVFVDPRSRQLRQQANSLAAAELPVLILGETGTDKESSSASMPSAWAWISRRSAWMPRRRWRATPGMAIPASWRTSSTSPCW